MAPVRSLTHLTLATALLVALVTLATKSAEAFANTPDRCQETQIDVQWISGGAGLGHTAYLIEITNVSANACRLTGYPTVRMSVGASAVTTVAKRTRSGYMGGLAGATAPLPIVTLRAHGGMASSMVEGSHLPIGDAVSCTTYTKVSITLASLQPPYRFTTRFPGCVRPQVHPVVKGSTGSSPA